MTIDKLIPGKESDRLLTAIAAAFLVQGILALILGFIDWDAASTPKQQYGPVEVRLSEIEPVEPEVEELPAEEKPEELSPETREEPEQPSPEAPEKAEPSAAVSPRSEEAAPSDGPETPAPEEQAARQQRSSDAGRDEQIPSITEALREAREAEESGMTRESSGAPPQEMTAPSEESEQPEARRDPDAREERQPVPEQDETPQDQYSEGSRVELQDRPEEPAEGRTSGGERESAAREQESAAREQEQQESSVFDEGTLDRIGQRDTGGRTAEAGETADGNRAETGSQQTGSTGGSAGDGTAGETGQTSGDAGVEVEFDSEGVSRRLRNSPIPKLTEDQLAKLPPKIELTLSFRLESSGIITSVSVLSGSGDTEVDTRIRQAVREWRFDRSEGAEPVEGTLRIILRTGG